jgi:hypothetical protein
VGRECNKFDLKYERRRDVECIHVAQENVQWPSVVTTAMNLHVRNGRKFFSS